MKMVRIEWIDSKGVTTDWEFKDDLSELLPVMCISVGLLMCDEKDFKTIIQTDSKEQVLGRMVIPAESIKKIKILR